jgi:hypothetical protein
VVPSIPLDTAVDEISIQALISQFGYRLVYEPEAVVFNRGPATVGDFLRQRRRIYAGHLRVREEQSYSAPTMSVWRAARALSGSGSFTTPRSALWSLGTVGLEATARVLGAHDIIRHRSAHVWEISATTKDHIADGARAQTQQNIAVFHIIDFYRQQAEMGPSASRRLTRQVADHIKQVLGSAAVITLQQGGTIVALLPGDREAAEATVRELLQNFENALVPLKRQGRAAEIALACGMIAFPNGGPPLARSIPRTDGRSPFHGLDCQLGDALRWD